MKDKLNIFFKLQSQIYRFILFFLSVTLIVYIIPKKGKFQYEFDEGKPWKYETLIAPFDFSILKTKSDINIDEEITDRKVVEKIILVFMLSISFSTL